MVQWLDLSWNQLHSSAEKIKAPKITMEQDCPASCALVEIHYGDYLRGPTENVCQSVTWEFVVADRNPI